MFKGEGNNEFYYFVALSSREFFFADPFLLCCKSSKYKKRKSLWSYFIVFHAIFHSFSLFHQRISLCLVQACFPSICHTQKMRNFSILLPFFMIHLTSEALFFMSVSILWIMRSIRCLCVAHLQALLFHRVILFAVLWLLETCNWMLRFSRKNYEKLSFCSKFSIKIDFYSDFDYFIKFLILLMIF